jgi:hypothetical protein
MFQRSQLTQALDQLPKTFAGVLKEQRGACFKAFVALKQRFGEEARYMLVFPDINSQVHRLTQEHGNGLEFRPPFRWFRHNASLQAREKQGSESATSKWSVERSKSVEVPLPSTAKRFGCPSPQTYQGFPTPPPLRVQGSVPTMSKGVFRLWSWKSDSQVTSPLQYYTNFCPKSRMIPAVYVKS